MSGRPLIFALPGQEALAADLARALPGETGALAVRRFPDGETYVRVDSPCEGRDVVLACSLSRPDELAMPLLFAAHGVRDLGARRLVLAAPYLSYMRQDARFRPGEVLTAKAFARFLSAIVDGIATIDPHLHRYRSLSDIYRVPTRVGHAAEAIAMWITYNVSEPLVVGPDIESEQWVSQVAESAAAPYVVMSKTRRGDQDVVIEAPALDRWRGRSPVLVDDIVSTARTMAVAVRRLVEAGYPAPVCIGVHAVFTDDAWRALKAAGARRVVTSNTIRHPSNSIDLMDELARAVNALF